MDPKHVVGGVVVRRIFRLKGRTLGAVGILSGVVTVQGIGVVGRVVDAVVVLDGDSRRAITAISLEMQRDSMSQLTVRDR